MIKEIIKTARPHQWIKNLLVFIALFFSKNLFHPTFILKTLFAFFLFCFISTSVYFLNDIFDIKKDRLHPQKRFRPIAQGDLSPIIAMIFAIFLAFITLCLSYLLGLDFLLLLLIYLVIQIGYNIFFKNMIILDIFAVASGFFIRILAGVFAIDVPLSSWLVISAIMLSLFISIGKRRYEIILLKQEAINHRPILKEYSLSLLDQMISITTPTIIITYMLYTVAPETIKKFGTKNLIFTIPFLLYGLFRYLYLIYTKEKGGSPETILITDKPLLIDILFYIIIVGLILY
ncbi:MAG: decaprenyl-phosphate phosphoribosyltransferase [Deltaproteobacteria bacterium]|nr:decaprenyl-phosphate phosphoribosyltransferase [Deltaproteobacteria bacterium]